MVARSDLPTERWLTFFEELGNLGVMDVSLTGGEVFTRQDIFELIDGIIANRMRYCILSNGTLITEETLAEFEVGKRRTRLDSIQVSIDGSTPEIHNKSRPGSFERALRGLRLLAENDFPVTVRVTINKHNVKDLENIARLLLEDVGIPSFGTNEAFPMGSGKCSGESVILTREQRQSAMNTLVALNEKYQGRISASAGPLAMARALADIQARIARGETGKPGRGTLSACGGVFTRMCINHAGTFLPCTMLSSMPMGKVGTDDLQDVWLNHPSINAVRERLLIPTETLDTCQDCVYAGFCTAGCPAMAFNATDKLNARAPMSCYRIHLEEDPYDTL
jgi:SynChlorMet cassette radical SAM/SPASM protein ScmE